MPSKRRSDGVSGLIVEMRNLSDEVRLLRVRLTGDEQLQTKGLIHDVELAAAEAVAAVERIVSNIPTEELDRLRWLARHLWKIFVALIASGTIPLIIEIVRAWR